MPMNCLRPRRAARTKSRPLYLLFLLAGRAGDHGDVLCAYPVGRDLGNDLNRLLRAAKSKYRPNFEIMPIVGGERGKGIGALAVVESAAMITDDESAVVADNPGLQNLVSVP